MALKSFYCLFAGLVAATLSDSAGALQSSLAAGLIDELDDLPQEHSSSQHPLAAGEVVLVDRAAGTITVRRQPIPEFFMTETATMIFAIADKSMLEGLTPGDKIRFKVERAEGLFVIVRLEHSN